MDIIAEFEAVIDALSDASVEHAVCGGFAVNIHGHVRATRDIDLLIPEDRIDDAKAALASVGFTVAAGPIPFGIGTPHARVIHRVSKIEGAAMLTVDLMLVAPVFQRTWASRQRFTWRGKDVSVVSLGGLAQMKRLAARTQDLADLESLAISDLEPDDG